MGFREQNFPTLILHRGFKPCGSVALAVTFGLQTDPLQCLSGLEWLSHLCNGL